MPRRKDPNALLDKEKLFCAEYLTDFDAKNAAIRAAYRPRYAGTQGYRLLQRPNIQQHIKQLTGVRLAELDVTASAVIKELSAIAFSRAEEFLAVIAEQTGLPPIKGKLPAAINQRIIQVDAVSGIRVITHFSLRGKIDALCALGRNLGVFAKETNAGNRPLPPLMIMPRGKRFQQLNAAKENSDKAPETPTQ